MQQMEENIAYNLRKIRKSRNMSLDLLAQITGVSKSMLGQIERGESNPTIGTVGKIVEGLKVSFEDLLYSRESEVKIVDKEDYCVLKKEEGKYTVKSIFPYDQKNHMEINQIMIQGGERYCGRILGENAMRYLLVKQGNATVEVDQKRYYIAQGDAMRISSKGEYVFCNMGNSELIIEEIMSLQLK